MRRARSWGGWDVLPYDYTYEWSDTVMIVDDDGVGLEMWCKDDASIPSALPPLPRLSQTKVPIPVLKREEPIVEDVKVKEPVAPAPAPKKSKKSMKLMFKMLSVEHSRHLLILPGAFIDDENGDTSIDEEDFRMSSSPRGRCRVFISAPMQSWYLILMRKMQRLFMDFLKTVKVFFVHQRMRIFRVHWGTKRDYYTKIHYYLSVRINLCIPKHLF
mmetsp:Transcript_4557/g.6787  ORF Transcript_4557/g.6787 Transcript_4557/m.6787 type:complete len:215 (+) Transcript_4557:324-968(+)